MAAEVVRKYARPVAVGVVLVAAGLIVRKVLSKPKMWYTRDESRLAKARKAAAPLRAALEELRRRVKGRMVIVPLEGDDATEYHNCRETTFFFNAAGYPCAHVMVEDEADIVKCVDFARQHRELQLYVAGGKHSFKCMSDCGLVVDLKKMNNVTVNVRDRTADIEGGAILGDVDAALAPHGLGTPTGTHYHTGCVGLTLGGGTGFLLRKYGFSCDNVLSARVVTADGKAIDVDDNNEHSGLMKALRGGSGTFGIVVSMKVRLYDVSNCVGGVTVHLAPTMASAKRAMMDWHAKSCALPDEASTAMAVPCGAPVLPVLHSYIGDKAASFARPDDLPCLKELSELDGTWMRMSKEMRKMNYHTELQRITAPLDLPQTVYMTSLFITDLSEAMIDVILQSTRKNHPNNYASLVLMSVGGKATDPRAAARSVLSHRNSKHWVIFLSTIPHPSEEGKVVQWTETLRRRLQQLDPGAQLCPHPLTAEATFEETHRNSAERQYLKAMKAKYDPSYMFIGKYSMK
eukprot:Sspe_Gene.110412::Locus_91193_Transcript_2_2_Confidence_0.500_Length_1643::g.110412::m.110412